MRPLGPVGPSGRIDGLLAGRLLAVALLEARHAAAGVEDLLLARVERVAVAADVGVDDAVTGRAPGREGVTTGARHRGLHVLRVDAALHWFAPWARGRRVVLRPVGAHVNRNLLQCARPLNQGPDPLIPVLTCGCVAQRMPGSGVRDRASAEQR